MFPPNVNRPSQCHLLYMLNSLWDPRAPIWSFFFFLFLFCIKQVLPRACSQGRKKEKEERGRKMWVVSSFVKSLTFWSSRGGKHNFINDSNKQNTYLQTLGVPQRSWVLPCVLKKPAPQTIRNCSNRASNCVCVCVCVFVTWVIPVLYYKW